MEERSMWKEIDWGQLSTQQLGRYAEHLIALDCLLHGAEVYLPEVDERGVDLLIRHVPESGLHESPLGVAVNCPLFFEIQVKSIRVNRSKYIFFRKSQFRLRESLLAGIVLFEEGEEPRRYLIPSRDWLHSEGSRVLCSYEYKNRRSAPEWGLRASAPGRRELEERYALRTVLTKLLHPTPETV